MTKIEFGSRAWIELAGRLLDEMTRDAGPAIAGQSASLCEIYLNPPPHLLASGEKTLACTFRIANGVGSSTASASEDVDMVMTLDFARASVGAHSILSDAPEAIEQRARARKAAADAGLLGLKGGLDHIPMPVKQLITRWHNRLAKLTA